MTELVTIPGPGLSLATYVFAVCRAADAPALDGVTGHGDGGTVRPLPVGSLAAMAQDVPAAGHDEESLRRRLSDRAELERYARAHHEVVAAVCDVVPAVPLPLATLYHGEERARQAVAAGAARFHRVLDHIDGRAEWGVKVYALARERAAPEDPAKDRTVPAPGDPGASASGRAYLDRLRGRHQAREERQQAAWLAAERVDAALRGLAVEARRLRAQPAEPGQGGESQLLNAAYLVERARAAELADALGTLARAPETADRVRIEVTGPWAPYSFTNGDDADGQG
ncbi:GvpL/GvpF family gas vesicle protein [Streptomyces sp. SBT349]|uniref:GvpL/GvpF family gas vesicle protein n=1 Tax=Streptomyces sp. SBT349 TaxID=1580539 RepID=UPI00066A155B|nr:GvpL/GvpF family gas vesicle protein [Streptomyces sp. SBT349]